MAHDPLSTSVPQQITRRSLLKRSLGLTLSIPAVAGLLAACGGDDDDPTATTAAGEPTTAGGDPTATSGSDGGPTATSGGSGEPTATTSGSGETPQSGGMYQAVEAGNPASLDPYLSGSQAQSLWSSYTYSRMFMLLSGPDIATGSLETTPDLAASVEAADDGLAYTMPIRDNAYWHPPIDRLVTADDIVWSWSRFIGGLPGGIVSDRYSDRVSFITTCEKVDDLTVVFNLDTPYPFFLAIMADPKVFFVMPPEFESEYNPAEMVIGSGPWIMDSYTPDSNAVYSRNPKWHLGPEIPYFDQVTVNIIGEYATQLTQFMGGNIDVLAVQGSDIQRVLDEVEGVQIYQTPAYPLSVLNFSPNEERWEDERLRRAVSMGMDRDAMLDAAYGLQEIAAAGVDVPYFWHNNIPAAFSEYWLDPKGDEIDPDVAANFAYDPDSAAALVEEAGGPFETELHYAAANSRYGEPYRIISELFVQYMGQIGITVTAIEEDYNTQFLGENGTSSGYFDGMFWIPQTRTDPYAYIVTQFLSPNHLVYGRWQDAELTAAAEAIATIQDPDELVQAIKDFQNMAGKKMYIVPMQYGAAPTFLAYQPWVQNALVYQTFAQGGATENLPHWWTNR